MSCSRQRCRQAVIDRVHQVEDRADAADAEPGDQDALVARDAGRPQQAQPDRRGARDEEQEQHEPERPRPERTCRTASRPATITTTSSAIRSSWPLKPSHGLHHVRAGELGVRRELLFALRVQHQLGLRRARRLVALRVRLDPLQREPRGEYREKSRREAQLRDAVGDRDQPQREELVEARPLPCAACAGRRRACRSMRPERTADRQSAGDGPHDVDRQPAPAAACRNRRGRASRGRA